MCMTSARATISGRGLADLVSDVVWHLKRNGPWRYKLSDIYDTPEIDQAVAELTGGSKVEGSMSVRML